MYFQIPKLKDEDDSSTEDSTTTTTESETTTTDIITTEITTTEITTTEIPEEEEDWGLIIGLSVTASIIVIIVLAALAVFLYIRSKRRKIQGCYRPADLEIIQAQNSKAMGPYILPLPQPERLI